MIDPVFWKGQTDTDSSVFKYVAFVMSKGGMPYKDAFDHKGPLIYIYNFIGQQISSYRGVWVVEFISMLIFCYFGYKIARFFCNKVSSLLILMLACSSFASYFEGGNLVEEYALPFIASSLYIYLDFLINEKITKLRLMMCGVGLAAVCLLRPNMIAIWAVFSIAVLVCDIYKREKKWLFYVIYFFLGFMLLMLPIVIWLVAKGAFAGFISDYLIFNIKYSNYDDRSNIVNKYDSITNFLGWGLTLGTVPIIGYSCAKRRNLNINVTYLVYVAINLIFMSMSGMSYGHYGMIMIPMLIYPYASLFSGYNIKMSEAERVCLTFFLLYVTFPSWSQIGRNTVTEYYMMTKYEENDIYDDVTNVIVKNTSEDDEIIVIGNRDYWYTASKRKAASVYSYQLPIALVDEDILHEFQSDMINNKPIIVVEQLNTGYDFAFTESLFPNKNLYEVIHEDDATRVYKLNE